MQHDWTNNITGPEIFQEVRHSCLNGRKLVSKLAFQTGAETNFMDEIMSSCQVIGIEARDRILFISQCRGIAVKYRGSQLVKNKIQNK